MFGYFHQFLLLRIRSLNQYGSITFDLIDNLELF